MHAFARRFEDFVREVAGGLVSWGDAVPRPLSQLVRQRYVLREIRVGEQCFLGIQLKSNEDFKPAAFEKHLGQLDHILADYDGYCVIADGLPGYVRQRMVERQIPFVDVGRQLYWPELGVAYQKKKQKSTPPPVNNISPATQVVLIDALVGGLPKPVTPKMLAEKLGYTPMTMTRAFDEIEALKLCTVRRVGRERQMLVEARAVLWPRVKPFLKSPVRGTVRVKEDLLPPDLRLAAGETALAKKSMLVPPNEPVYAMWSKRWKALAEITKTIPIEDEGTCQVQLWRYDPVLFARNDCVDPFSLFLSLQHVGDERVESALEEMMEKLEWS